ncbi:MAG: response regulator transcription factor [Chitinophagaceae bacterium]|nr:response regulator transcription factor [Chitinophagaceae bacterium]
MKILVVDNEIEIRELLKEMIIACSSPGEHSIEVAEGVESGLKKINSFKPDVVFLDVEMPDGTGFDLMKRVMQPVFQLVFITAHNQYAVQAFKCSAIDYLLKPFDVIEIENSLQKAAVNLENKNLGKQLSVLIEQFTYKENTDKQIVLKDNEATYFVKLNDILYCEAENSYTRFFIQHTSPVLISKTLSTFEDFLKEYGFIRTHHSYLVNIDKIKMYDKSDGGNLVLKSGEIVPVSHRKKDFVMQVLESR